ncbi:iron reductase domain protein [Lepidopterella palustris CBS 459.81]|uniref:Iron reductase domain protein n=1 Tax=Lepidopterella palustris CBS 459.81 TaxID=1314670 RepID=A0A8E2JJR9_9PEZI|nr:iron reductase domain protein [Lepidopterella palustris CBS 459.81]
MLPSLLPILLLALILPSRVSSDSNPAASTLYLSETGTTFSLNIPNNSSDVYIYFSSPAYSWFAVGAGDKMAGSLMLIMYPSANNKNVTVSPRIATGNSEPTFAPEIQISVLPGTTIFNDSFVLNAICHNCRSWNGGSLDLTAVSQPWMYAFGPAIDLYSDSPEAPLRRHREYGYFTMDMNQATGLGGVPIPSTSMNGARLVGDVVMDGDKASVTHGILIVFAVLILYPLNVILVGFFKSMKFHVVFSIIIMCFILAGFGVGIYVSGEYNRSKHFTSAHQIFGFIIVAIFIALAALGGLVSRQRRVQPTPASDAPRKASTLELAHTWTGRGVWVLAIINGGTGLKFSSSPMHTQIIYALVTIAIALPLVIVYSIMWRRRRVKKEEEEEDRDVVLQAYYATQPKQEVYPAQGYPPQGYPPQQQQRW